MKPWERALKREPMCEFVEAILDGYSPLNAVTCRMARVGAAMREHDPYWSTPGPTWPWNPGKARGSVHWYRGGQLMGSDVDVASGEVPWR